MVYVALARLGAAALMRGGGTRRPDAGGHECPLLEGVRMTRTAVHRCLRSALLGAFLLLLPGIASAQSSITGLVRDSSGAVLPGVTVEAASPALIEKVRTAVTDESGANSEIMTFSTSLGRPTAILQPRTLRLALQARF
jgi:hypothetical protein